MKTCECKCGVFVWTWTDVNVVYSCGCKWFIRVKTDGSRSKCGVSK